MRPMSKPSSGRLSYEAFRGRFGMPDRQGAGILFRFVDPAVVTMLESVGSPFTVIADPASVRIWAERLDKAARACKEKDPHGQDERLCCCVHAHAPDRTVLIAQPVQ